MRLPCLLSCLGIGLSLLTLGSPAVADTVSWRFPFDGDWNSPANWLPGHVPGPADTVLITAAGTYTVTAGSGTAINVAALVLGNASGAQRLSADHASITTAQGLFVQDAGTLALDTTPLAGPVVNDATIECWTGTTFPPGFTTMPGSRTRLRGDTGSYTFPSGFTNHGSIEALTDRSYIYLNFGGSFTNAADGTVSAASLQDEYAGALVFSGNIVNDGRVDFEIPSFQSGTILNRNSWLLGSTEVRGAVVNEGWMNVGGTVLGGVLENRDSLEIVSLIVRSGGSLVLTRGQVVGYGPLRLDSATLRGDSISLPLDVNAYSSQVQAHSLQIPAYRTFSLIQSPVTAAVTVDGTLAPWESTVSGAIVVNHGGLLQPSGPTTTAGIVNRGRVTIPSGTTLTVRGTFANDSSGVLGGDGTLDLTGGSLAQNGVLAPGTTSPGVLRITGDVALPSSSTLVIDLAGTTFGSQYDHLAVSNAVALGGTLKVQLAPGFAPAAGDSFLILTGSAVSGTFDEVVGDFVPVYESDRVVLVALAPADLALAQVDSPDPALVDSMVTYVVWVQNRGPGQARQVMVRDQLPLPSGAHVTASRGVVSDSSGWVLWSLGVMPVRDIAILTIQQDLRSTGNLTNRAWVTSATGDPDSSNNASSERTRVMLAVADLALSHAVVPRLFTVHDDVTHTVSLSNWGPNGAEQVIVRDQVPFPAADYTLNVSRGTVSDSSGWGVWRVGSLGVGETVTLTLKQHLEFLGVETNRASVVSATADPDPSNNAVSESTLVVPIRPTLGVASASGITPVVLRFAMPSEAPARIDIFDVSGRRVRTVARGTFAPGPHDVTWDDSRGRAAGLYFGRLVTPQGESIVRILLRP